MDNYNSNFLKFEPVDMSTEKGRKRLERFFKDVAYIRTHPPEKRGRMFIPYDENGIFLEPQFAQTYVRVVVQSREEFVNNMQFFTEFCRLYLKSETTQRIKVTMRDQYSLANDTAAVIWVGFDIPENFVIKNRNFAYDEAVPVFIIGKQMLAACQNKDVNSEFVRSRMIAVANAAKDAGFKFIYEELQAPPCL